MANNKKEVVFAPTKQHGVFRVVLVNKDGVETPTTTTIRAIVSDEPIEDDEICPPEPTTNPSIRRSMWLNSLLSMLLRPIHYLLWWKAIQKADNPCQHRKTYRQTISPLGKEAVVYGALMCVTCLEGYYLRDIRRICIACGGPIAPGSWVSSRRMEGTDRYVHFETCSGEHWCATIWLGDDVRVIGHGI